MNDHSEADSNHSIGYIKRISEKLLRSRLDKRIPDSSVNNRSVKIANSNDEGKNLPVIPPFPQISPMKIDPGMPNLRFTPNIQQRTTNIGNGNLNFVLPLNNPLIRSAARKPNCLSKSTRSAEKSMSSILSQSAIMARRGGSMKSRSDFLSPIDPFSWPFTHVLI